MIQKMPLKADEEIRSAGKCLSSNDMMQIGYCFFGEGSRNVNYGRDSIY